MPPKKKPVLEDSDLSDDEIEKTFQPKKKPVKKASPKKVAKQLGSALTSDRPDEAEEPVVEQGYSGKYDHTGDKLLKVAIPERSKPIMCADGSGSRLMIKEILVTNFKSYYGTQRIGPFHKNFSAIIGPNGSGKSNVIDSLLFVFGFRASRIRLKKLKELIHNSSGKDKPQFCCVEIAFQKIIDTADGGYSAVECTEFRVGRTAYQDSTSKYTINGKGEVEQIALMKCKAEGPNKEGMLEYLEDIIGSSRLNPFINDIGLKIDEINTEKSQQNQRVKAAEKEREALEGPVREMISHLRCENQAMLINNKLSTIKRIKLEQDLETLIPKREKVKVELDDAQAKHAEMTECRNEIQKEYADLETEKEKTQALLATTQKTIIDVETREARRKIDNKKCIKDLKVAKDKLKNAEQELEDVLQVPEKSRKLIEMKEGEITELLEEVKENDKKYEKNQPIYEEKVSKLREASKIAEEVKGQKTVKFDDIGSKRRIAEEKLNMNLSESEKHKNRMEEFKRQLRDAQMQMNVKQSELEKIKLEFPNCERALNEAQELVGQINEQVKAVTKQRQALDRNRDALAAVASTTQDDDKNGVIAGMNALLEAKQEGKLQFHGRLGDLGTVDDIYQKAISHTTSGLNNFVVQSKKDGDVALDIIKKIRCGRHSIIVLDSIGTNRLMDHSHNLPAPRIFDKVNISKPEYRKAFFSVFQNTMIVERMDDARRHFNNFRARYITMEGGVMDASGTLSGGGNNKQKFKPQLGPMSGQVENAAQARDAKEAREKLVKVDADIRNQNEAFESLRVQAYDADSKLFQLSKEKQKYEETQRVLVNETNNLNARIVNLERNIEQLSRTIANETIDTVELEKLRRDVETLTAEHDNAKKELDEANEAFQKADSAVTRIYKELLGRFRDAAKLAEGKIAAGKNDINTENMKLNTFEKDKKKIESKVEGAKVVIENKEKELKILEKGELSNEQTISELQEKKREHEAAISEMETKIKEGRKISSKQDEEEGILVKIIDKLSDEYKGISENMDAIRHNIEKTKKFINSLKLHRIKDYGILPEKVRKPAQHDHIIDEETLAEEKAHQKKVKKRKADDIDEDADSDGDDGALPLLTEEDVKDCDRDELKFRLQQLEDKVRKNKEQLNMKIIDEYTEKTKKYTSEHAILTNMQENHKRHMSRMEEWKRVRLQEFMEGFTEIGKNLKEMYQMITLGGDASLDLKDSLDPFSEGIQFMVRPPKKSWKNIENLSGGEKTLSSLSLVFALHKYRPTPLYVMDEIDAALDFRNVSIIGHYVKEKTKNAQFIIISLRNNMFELGDRLIGIYKTFDCTKNIVVDPAAVMKEALSVRTALQMLHNVEQDGCSFSPEKNRLANVRISSDDLDISITSGGGVRKRHSIEDASTSKRVDLRLSPTSDRNRPLMASGDPRN